ncbi:MAG TPA: hypothetical protein DIT89_03775 [Planctomycetaceae bacterium]|nr:hypothetical protein [Planctomycetaceae bacterium]
MGIEIVDRSRDGMARWVFWGFWASGQLLSLPMVLHLYVSGQWERSAYSGAAERQAVQCRLLAVAEGLERILPVVDDVEMRTLVLELRTRLPNCVVDLNQSLESADAEAASWLQSISALCPQEPNRDLIQRGLRSVEAALRQIAGAEKAAAEDLAERARELLQRWPSGRLSDELRLSFEVPAIDLLLQGIELLLRYGQPQADAEWLLLAVEIWPVAEEQLLNQHRQEVQ